MKLLVFLGCLFFTIDPCRADGGAMVARQTINGLDLTVFASPAPLRAGPVDVSVLVQDAVTHQPSLDAHVDVSWSSVSSSSPEWMPPCCSMTTSNDTVTAQRAHSQNKYLYSTMVTVRSSGTSALVVRVNSGSTQATLACDMVSAPPAPPVRAYWPFLAFPPFVMAGFALHQKLANRRGGSARKDLN